MGRAETIIPILQAGKVKLRPLPYSLATLPVLPQERTKVEAVGPSPEAN